MAQQFTEPKKAMEFEVGKTYEATITTSKGEIVCELNSKAAPLSVTNFIQLAKGGFYNGLKFHRVEPGFVVQGGDPQGDGRGGPGYTIPAEIGLKHEQAALAWARLPDQVNPQKRSSGSQFYITLAPTPFLDNEYTVFGKVTKGFDVVKQIKKGDVIERIDVVTK
ncbi:MAG: peptidylprolyl isomerase [Verrucomicrobia bacterium]|nr:peptidylprolyl isomerase [Verrucomicrobiota bacterium]